MPKYVVNPDFGKQVTKARLAGNQKSTAAAARLLGMSGQQLHQLETERGRNIRVKTFARLLSAFPSLKVADLFTVSK